MNIQSYQRNKTEQQHSKALESGVDAPEPGYVSEIFRPLLEVSHCLKTNDLIQGLHLILTLDHI